MAFTLFDFTKSWRNAGDFPTFEPDEAKVREDMQSLFDELKTGLNRLIGELRAGNLPFTPTAEVDSSDVQNAIENVQSQIASAILGELPDGSVTAQKLSDGAVETDKIEDGAVTTGKIAEGVLPEGAENNPLMDGEATAGESAAFAREDHVHPKDSTKADIVGGRVVPSQLTKARVNVTASRALELTDEGKALYISSGSAVTVTIPANSTVQLPIGSEIILYRAGTGTVIVDAASGVTLHCSGDLNGLGQYDTAKLKKWEANVWTYELAHNGVSDGEITAAKLADGSVGTSKLSDGAVTSAKIDNGAVTRANLADDALYSPLKLMNVSTYDVVADDIGKTVEFTYNGNISVNISNEVASALPAGAEIAFICGYNRSLSITIGSNWYLAKPGELGTKGRTLTCSDGYQLVAVKRIGSNWFTATGNFD